MKEKQNWFHTNIVWWRIIVICKGLTEYSHSTLRWISDMMVSWVLDIYNNFPTRVRSRRLACLVIWFCCPSVAKPGNKTGAPSWPDPYVITSNAPRLWLIIRQSWFAFPLTWFTVPLWRHNMKARPALLAIYGLDTRNVPMVRVL